MIIPLSNNWLCLLWILVRVSTNMFKYCFLHFFIISCKFFLWLRLCVFVLQMNLKRCWIPSAQYRPTHTLRTLLLCTSISPITPPPLSSSLLSTRWAQFRCPTLIVWLHTTFTLLLSDDTKLLHRYWIPTEFTLLLADYTLLLYWYGLTTHNFYTVIVTT